MNVRAQIATVFHLDKCIGCHTCSVSCKNIWTDRPGTEYMWWNNVETKPGTGYPTLWENQENYRGGWEKKKGKLRLRLQSKLGGLGNLFFNPHMLTMDDYYEPWTYTYSDLFNAPQGDDQPTARPVSLITGQPIDIKSGPNWDDDLSGSPVYAANDHGLQKLSAETRDQLFELERMAFFYLPRTCNHCLNPACVAACPSGAIYKRGEDGIVLLNQEKCRAWRMCVSACPYKKVYYNWSSGKSEKCIYCYPRLESGQAPACFHSCVGRIRYLGVLLYDADRLEEVAGRPDMELVEAQREMILDPSLPEVAARARQDGVSEAVLEAARRSPVYRFVKEYQIALPLHPEFRTLPMTFFVPPLLPLTASTEGGSYETRGGYFTSMENPRLPLSYLAGLFSGGNEQMLTVAYRKLLAVRLYRRSREVGDIPAQEVVKALAEAQSTPEEAEAIYRLTSLASIRERFVLPPMARESALEEAGGAYRHRSQAGFGFRQEAKRRW